MGPIQGRRRLGVDRTKMSAVQEAAPIDRFTNAVQHPAQQFFSDRDAQGFGSRKDIETRTQPGVAVISQKLDKISLEPDDFPERLLPGRLTDLANLPDAGRQTGQFQLAGAMQFPDGPENV